MSDKVTSMLSVCLIHSICRKELSQCGKMTEIDMGDAG